MEDYSRRHFVRMSLSSFAGVSLALPQIARGAVAANGLDGRIKEAAPLHWE